MRWTVIDSPIGALSVASDGVGVSGVHFGAVEEPGPIDVDAVLPAAVEELRHYFAGTLTDFTVPISVPRGSPFERAVWREMSLIPYGETRTYGAVAAAVGDPTAARAVGVACNRNPIPVIVPCHRIVGAGGKLVGFGGGLPRKRHLLELEAKVALARDWGAQVTPPTVSAAVGQTCWAMRDRRRRLIDELTGRSRQPLPAFVPPGLEPAAAVALARLRCEATQRAAPRPTIDEAIAADLKRSAGATERDLRAARRHLRGRPRVLRDAGRPVSHSWPDAEDLVCPSKPSTTGPQARVRDAAHRSPTDDARRAGFRRGTRPSVPDL